jgi:glycosyltransferase involved in cell wall biosynthesis
MFSFVVPAHNEEQVIARTLDSLNDVGRKIGEPFEIVVANDASTDRTGEIASQSGARIIEVNRRQIAAVRNAGARAAEGDRLIFVDADTVVTEEVVRGALAAMKHGAVGGGAAITYDGEVPRYGRVLTPILVRVFRAAGFACGCFVFCTRDAFEAAGGFSEEVYASEEIGMSRRLKRQGRFVVLREAVITSGRKLRCYSGREVLGQFAHFLLGGPSALKRREGLDLWYGERRHEVDAVPARTGRQGY